MAVKIEVTDSGAVTPAPIAAIVSLTTDTATDKLYDTLRPAHDRGLLLSASDTARAAGAAALL
eukprot:12929747-Prorocentrum_lima.AAC.1